VQLDLLDHKDLRADQVLLAIQDQEVRPELGESQVFQDPLLREAREVKLVLLDHKDLRYTFNFDCVVQFHLLM